MSGTVPSTGCTCFQNDLDSCIMISTLHTRYASCVVLVKISIMVVRQLIVIILNCGFCKRNALVYTFIFLNYAFLGCVASKDNLGVLTVSLIGLGRRQSCLFQRHWPKTNPGGGNGKGR
jgi:hypothetical protein